MPTARKKVLIVEDEPTILETMRFAVEHAGYECILAKDGIEAVQMTREHRPDLLLLDIMLPKLSGYKVCRLLKFDERYKHIPVIMVTARAQEKDRALGLETGADAYVTKPFDLDELIKLVAGHIGPGEPAAPPQG